MANSYLSRTPGSTTDAQRKQFTISIWVKRSTLGTGGGHQEIVSTNATDQFGFRFDGDNKLDIFEYSVSGNNYPLRLTTNRLFRDTSAWYNIVLQVDTPNATSSNRAKIWVNGVQETSFATATYPSQDYTTTWNKNGLHQIGSKAWGNSGNGSDFFNGYLSHVANVAGSVLAPTVFGETDSTSGIWKFKSPSGVTWGTNGFHLKFESSGNLGLDSSGNSNTFSVNGNLKQALDTPSNVYATLNLLDKGSSSLILKNGNTTVDTGGSDYGVRSALAVNSGKYYWEAKCNTSGNTYGIIDMDVKLQINIMSGSPTSTGAWGFQNISSGTKVNTYNNGTFTSYTSGTYDFPNWGTSDVLGVALDMDNGKIYFSKNGTFYGLDGNSSDPVNQTNPCFTGLTTDGSKFYGAYTENRAPTTNGTLYNFGNGYFGTTAISSAGSNGNGSLFEYDVPSGYYALNTKNINTYG